MEEILILPCASSCAGSGTQQRDAHARPSQESSDHAAVASGEYARWNECEVAELSGTVRVMRCDQLRMPFGMIAPRDEHIALVALGRRDSVGRS
jgi:hypothetical protein